MDAPRHCVSRYESMQLYSDSLTHGMDFCDVFKEAMDAA
jgi:hypothetical protein